VTAAAVAAGSVGDVVVLAALLALAAPELAPVIAAGLVAASVTLRFGSSSLTALAGAQAVLGPAGVVGPASATASGWLGALGLVVAAPPGWAAVAFGLGAAAVVAGPAPRTAGDLVVRSAASLLAVGLAVGAARWLPRWAAWLGAAAAAGSAALVAGRWRTVEGPAWGSAERGLSVAVATGLLVIVGSSLAAASFVGRHRAAR
jgi:hypothetical protein